MHARKESPKRAKYTAPPPAAVAAAADPGEFMSRRGSSLSATTKDATAHEVPAQCVGARVEWIIFDDATPESQGSLTYDCQKAKGAFHPHNARGGGGPTNVPPPKLQAHPDAELLRRPRHIVTHMQDRCLLRSPTIDASKLNWAVFTSRDKEPWLRVLYIPEARFEGRGNIARAMDAIAAI
jgi:hypothetical protein